MRQMKRRGGRLTFRYVAMCIPGRESDMSDDWWCVYDTKRRRTVRVVGTGLRADEAKMAARRYNKSRSHA